MKVKIIMTLLLVFLFFFVVQNSIFAQGVLPGMPDIDGGNMPEPGINCGILDGNGDLNKCCKSQITKTKSTAIDLNNSTIDAAKALLQPMIDKFTNEIVQKQKSVVVDPCVKGVPSKKIGDKDYDSCICISDKTAESLISFESMCQNIKTAENNECLKCARGNEIEGKKGGVWTALGCFDGNVSLFITNNIMKTGIGLAGGISLLCIMMTAFQMQTSSGNAEKVKKAQELMTNCITGLMVIIFSILILKIIGVDILRIPGFN